MFSQGHRSFGCQCETRTQGVGVAPSTCLLGSRQGQRPCNSVSWTRSGCVSILDPEFLPGRSFLPQWSRYSDLFIFCVIVFSFISLSYMCIAFLFNKIRKCQLFVRVFLTHFETHWDALWHKFAFWSREGSETSKWIIYYFL